MNKKLLALPLLTLALVLTGCKTKPVDSSSSGGSEIPSSETSGSSQTVDPNLAKAEEMLLDFGYKKVSAWPTALITKFLSDNKVTESVPVLSTKTPLFYDSYADQESGALTFEIAILDSTLASLTSAYNILDGNDWVVYEEDLANGFFDFDSPLGQFIVSGELYEGDEDFPEATYLYITVPGDGGGDVDPVVGDAEEMLLDFGYKKVTAWPAGLISSLLTSNGITESVPELSNKTPLFYDSYADQESGAHTFEIAILDSTLASLTSAYNILDGSNWNVYEDDLANGYFDFDSPLGQLYVSGEVYDGDEVFPAATYLYITIPNGGDGGEPVDPITVTGWPTEVIEEYLESFGIDVVVPSLDITEEITVEWFNDDAYETGLIYLGFFIENENLVSSYHDLLEANDFNLEEDQDYEDSYYAYDESWGEVYIEFFYGETEEAEGTVFYISALVDKIGGGGNSGEVIPPTNPDKKAVFTFVNESQIDGVKNADQTTWKSGASTFVITKTGSNEPVGNNTFFSDPLRIYNKQTVVITAGGNDLIEQIKFDVDLSKDGDKDSIGQLIGLLSSKTTYFTEGSSVTFVFATPVASVTLKATAQFRISGMTLYFA